MEDADNNNPFNFEFELEVDDEISFKAPVSIINNNSDVDVDVDSENTPSKANRQPTSSTAPTSAVKANDKPILSSPTTKWSVKTLHYKIQPCFIYLIHYYSVADDAVS
jgi:hypothetical protein